jgi:hypothetical protein
MTSPNEPVDAEMAQVELVTEAAESPVSRLPLYSPKQVYTGSMLGGPIAAVYFVWKNFKTLADERRSRRTLVLGGILSALFLLILPLLPEKTPNMVIPIAYSGFAYYMVKTFQKSKEQITGSEAFTFQSNWRVFGVSILSLTMFVPLAFGMVFWAEQRNLPPHHAIAARNMRLTVEALESRKKEKAFVVFAVTPKDAKAGEDDVNLEYRIVEGTPTLLWTLLSKRNIADKDKLSRFAQEQGITLFEVQDGNTRLLFSQDVRIKELGERILREFYQLAPDTKVEVFEGQG